MKTIEELLTVRYQKRDTPLPIAESKDCPRCHGTGRLLQYGYFKNGKCFACNGTGKE